MTHWKRRDVLKTVAGLAALPARSLWAADETSNVAIDNKEPLPVAAIVTEYRDNSHADVIIGKILEGWKQDGGVGPNLKVAGMYTDQIAAKDMSRDLARKHGFPIFETIEEAITLGTGKVAVAGVLSIGEHGQYPHTPDTHQHMYPRRRFFDEIVTTFEKYGQTVPVFNDKHLGYAWDDAWYMVQTAREMCFPLMAGSSIPVAWRVPPLELKKGTPLEEAFAHGYGDVEAYGFHTLEGMQCMIERRKGGETGVVSVEAVTGEGIWQAEKEGRWSRDLLEASIGAEPGSFDPAQLPEEAKFFLMEHRDGLRSAMAIRTGLKNEFSFAARVAGQDEPVATIFDLQDWKPFRHFGYLVAAIEHMIVTGKPAYPVERTLLTTGVLDAAMHSLAQGGKRIATPQLKIEYTAVDWPYPPGLPEPSSPND